LTDYSSGQRSFEALAARLTRATQTGDTGLLLDPAALDEVDGMLNASPSEILQHPAWPVAIGMLHWIRFHHLTAAGSGDADIELDKAFLMFTGVRGVVPHDRIPREFHAVFDALDGDGQARPNPAFLQSFVRVMSGEVRDGEIRDRLIRALRLLTGVVAPPDRRSYLGAMLRLSEQLAGRYETGGDTADLDEAIEVCHRALAVAGDDRDRTGVRLVLANSSVRLFERTGNMRLLDEAIEAYSTGLDAFDAEDPATVPIAGNLSGALSLRFQWQFHDADIERAIAVMERAVDLGADDQADALVGLANCYLARYDRRRTAEDADAAIEILERAVAASSPASVDLMFAEFSLGRALLERAENTPARDDDTARAVDLLRSATAGLPAGSTHQTQMLTVLAYAMRMRSARTDGDEAHAWLRDAETTSAAAVASEASPAWRCRALAESAYAAVDRGDWESATARFTTAVEILPTLAQSGLDRRDQELRLANLRGVATAAAACAIRAGDAVAAVGLLELGRGVLLAGDIRTRRPDDDGGPLTEAELVATAAAGPIVIVNTSELGCDALVISRNGVDAVPLKDLTFVELGRRLLKFHDDLAEFLGSGSEGAAGLRDLLGWLWDVVAVPVFDQLGFTGVPAEGHAPPRLWLIPTGPLTFLPLHAAGYHGAGDQPGTSMMDRVVVSYASTVRALRHVAAESTAISSPRRSVVVAAPQVPGLTFLSQAAAEAQMVAAKLGTRPMQDGVTGAAVLRELTTATWAHFACHAYSQLMDPSTSHLALPDGPLPVSEISQLDNPHAEFAYLSACSTARGGAVLADEGINIAQAFQLAGFKEVIATQWPVWDSTARQVARLVYDNLADQPETPGVGAAVALHAAVRHVRDRYRDRPHLWAAYIHAGR
jgi:tetratricopeptide (TPR) repeat protein